MIFLSPGTPFLFFPSHSLRGWAVAFWIGALFAGVIGIILLFNESRIVGGDAYNYIIGAMRGVGWICLGVLCDVLACALLLFALRYEMQQRS